MNEFFIDIAITTLLGLLTRTVPKDSASKKKWKRAILKVFKAIAAAYADDEDFALDGDK